jgi:hypothetical protein
VSLSVRSEDFDLKTLGLVKENRERELRLDRRQTSLSLPLMIVVAMVIQLRTSRTVDLDIWFSLLTRM